MKLLSSFATVCALLALCTMNVRADDAVKPPKPPKPEVVAMTLTGVITAKTVEKKKKDGTVVQAEVRTLKTESGMVGLPKSDVDYTEFNGQRVEVVGEGYTTEYETPKGKKTKTVLKSVSAVTAAPEAPAE